MFQWFVLTYGSSTRHTRDMARTRGTVKSDKAEAKHKLRQRARKPAFDPKKHHVRPTGDVSAIHWWPVPDERFDWDEFGYYVERAYDRESTRAVKAK